MEGLSVSKVFGVPEDYTLEQLKKSYIEIIDNLYKSDRTEVEKELLTAQYKQMYKYGKRQYLEKVSIETDMEAPNYPYHSNYSTGYGGELDLFDRFERMHENAFGLSNRIRRSYNPFSMFDNVFRNVEQNFSNSNSNSNPNSKVYSYSSSYSSNTNPDGSRTIIERKSESTNGDKKQTINAYKKMQDGKTIPLTEDEMKQLEKLSGLQIEN
jgi:hypothetical protein